MVAVAAGLAAAMAAAVAAGPSTVVSIGSGPRGPAWQIGGQHTSMGSKVEGLLLNARLIQVPPPHGPTRHTSAMHLLLVFWIPTSSSTRARERTLFLCAGGWVGR